MTRGPELHGGHRGHGEHRGGGFRGLAPDTGCVAKRWWCGDENFRSSREHGKVEAHSLLVGAFEIGNPGEFIRRLHCVLPR